MTGISTLRRVLVGLILAAIVALVVTNVMLSNSNKQLRAQVQAEYRRQALAQSPVRGWKMPPLSGQSIKGTPMQLNLQSQNAVLLVFSASCAICDETWPAWNELLNTATVSPFVISITSDPHVAADYVQKHQLSNREVLLGLSPEVAKSMRLTLTPQTIVIKQGKVERSWVGPLTATDIRAIADSLHQIS